MCTERAVVLHGSLQKLAITVTVTIRIQKLREKLPKTEQETLSETLPKLNEKMPKTERETTKKQLVKLLIYQK